MIVSLALLSGPLHGLLVGGDEPSLVLRVSFSASSSGPWLLVDEVVTVEVDRDGVWPLVRETVLPRDRKGWVSRALIERRLRDAGLRPASFELRGPALCRIHDGKQK